MIRGLATVLVWGLLAAPVVAEPVKFVEGVQYQRLPQSVATVDDSKIEVVEVFSYACPHCRHFDPLLEKWRARQPADVAFRRVPATFNQTYALLAQAFYTAEALDIMDAMHEQIFSAIHDRGVDLRDPARMAALFHDVAGVSPETFSQVFNSFTVRSRVQQADAHTRAYRVTGVPTMIVDGTFRVDGQMAGTNDAMLDVVDFLVAQQRAAKNLAAGSSGPAKPAPDAAAQ